jgi:hypothetical protein
MDPIGLALENYNAIGQWRDRDLGKPIETAGQLITGEKFADARELGQVIAQKRRADFYRCISEKMLTYAIGRGMEYYDANTIDRLVDALEHDGGKMRTLIQGIVTSAPFEKRRGDGTRNSQSPAGPKPAASPTPRVSSTQSTNPTSPRSP